MHARSTEMRPALLVRHTIRTLTKNPAPLPGFDFFFHDAFRHTHRACDTSREAIRLWYDQSLGRIESTRAHNSLETLALMRRPQPSPPPGIPARTHQTKGVCVCMCTCARALPIERQTQMPTRSSLWRSCCRDLRSNARAHLGTEISSGHTIIISSSVRPGVRGMFAVLMLCC